MPEPSKQASLQRRANWVGLRTLRQRPKPIGTTDDGDPIYEIRSARLVLRGLSPHFDRLAPCARCGKEVPAATVLTVDDLDRPLRPVICTDCVRGTGVSLAWDPPAVGRPAEAQVEAEAVDVVVPAEPTPVAVAAEAAEAAEPDDGRLDLFERHLRAVTDRVNDLGQTLWSVREERDERRQADEAARSAMAHLDEQVAALARVGGQVDAQRSELAGVVSAIGEMRSELHRLSDANRELVRAQHDLEQRLGDTPVEASLAAQSQDLTALVAAQEALERRMHEVEDPPGKASPPVDLSDVERMVAGRLAEVEARVADRMASQSGQLASAIEASVRIYADGFQRAHDELTESQAGFLQRLDAVVSQLAQVISRVDAMASWVASTNDRLDAIEERAERALVAGAPRLDAPRWNAPAEAAVESGGLVETLERQLEGAASRLAARAKREPTDERGRGF